MSPRTPKAYEEIREGSRRKILMTALDLFATHGYFGTSISQIAQKAGVSKGLMYNYFESKEDLLKAIIDLFVQEGEEIFSPNLEAEPIEVLREIFEMYFKLLVEHKALNRLIIMLALQVHDHLTFIHDIANQKMKGYNSLLGHLLQELGYPNPAKEALVITALFDGIGIQYALLGEDYPLEKMRAYMLEKYCTHKYSTK